MYIRWAEAPRRNATVWKALILNGRMSCQSDLYPQVGALRDVAVGVRSDSNMNIQRVPEAGVTISIKSAIFVHEMYSDWEIGNQVQGNTLDFSPTSNLG